MDTAYPHASKDPKVAMQGTAANYSYDPHKAGMPAYNAPGYPPTSTVVTIAEGTSTVKDHIVWSIFSTLYMNCCCLGLVALVYSVKSRDRKGMGDRLGAIIYGSKARTLNIVTCILTAIWFIVMIILMALGFFSIPLIMRG